MVTFSTEAAKYATKFINSTNCHVFLTGKAGTGKTTFLKFIQDNTHKNTVVAAPTGIAAINAGGVTLHSLFQLPFGAFLPSDRLSIDIDMSTQISTPQSLLRNRQMNKTKRAMLQELELLIIDEVSMLRADLLDAIDVILRSIRRNKREFGGVQILFIGDLWQLPPVVKDDEWKYLQEFYSSIFFFEARALKDKNPVFLELDKIYRQSDYQFIQLLNNFRDNKVSRNDIGLLNNYYKPDFVPGKNEGYIRINTHNYQADNLNRKALENLPGKRYFFNAEIEGDFSEYQYPVEYTLELKKDAQVMFIKNDLSGENRYYNGKIGTISDISDDDLEVSFTDGSPATLVEPYTWENKRYTLNKETNQIEEKLLGTFSHFPIKLAWAITVHKSQGLTFEKAIIDVSKAFAPGQVYVALSRLTSLDGLVLTAPVPTSGLVPDHALSEFAQTKKQADTLNSIFEDESRRFITDYILKSFDFSFMLRLFGYHVESYNKDTQRSAKQQYHDWAITLKSDLVKLKDISDKFLNQLKSIIESKNKGYVNFLHERLLAAKDFFEPKLKEFSERVFSHIRELKSEKRIKTYLNELRDVELLLFRQLQFIIKAEAILKASIENKDLSKEELRKSIYISEREKMLDDGLRTKDRKEPSSKKKKDKKAEKPNTKEITFKFYEAGLNIGEIARERGLAVSTIEGHLAYYVATGKIPATQFVPAEKISKIIETIKTNDSTKLGDLKSMLSDNFSYSDLRFGVGHYISQLED